MMELANIHITDRSAFMLHAYNALFTGKVHSFEPELRVKIIAEITQDLCSLVRSMPKTIQKDFLEDVRQQIEVI